MNFANSNVPNNNNNNVDLNHQSVSQIPIPATTTDQAQAKIDCSASSAAVPNYGYYMDPNSEYYQQYYQQYYAYHQSMATSYDQLQPPSTTTISANQSYYYHPTVTNGSQTVVPGTTTAAAYLAAAAATQASYLPTLLAATSSNTSSKNGGVPNNYQHGDYNDNEDDNDDDDPTIAKPNQPKLSNILNYRCNEKMGLNPLIYTNIQQSPYFKTNLFQLKTFNEVIDEIFYSVKHLEPWEKGSRKNSGQTGMCGSVRGVGAGGIISTPFCILYKLFTLRLTRKQVLAMLRHKDSPYIRALGFMYVRFTQPSQDLWKWFEPYLADDETVDPKAGGGSPMTIGEMVRHFLTKLDWFATLFPRIPRQVQLDIEKKLKNYDQTQGGYAHDGGGGGDHHQQQDQKDHRISSKHHHHYHHANVKNDGRPKRSRSRSGSPSSSSKHRSKKYDHRKTNNHNNRYS